VQQSFIFNVQEPELTQTLESYLVLKYVTPNPLLCVHLDSERHKLIIKVESNSKLQVLPSDHLLLLKASSSI